MSRQAVLLVALTLSAEASTIARAQSQPAFPGAEGFGAFAPGGRGGDVYHVTNLNDAGPGSLRGGIQTAPATGRTIVFDVSGTIVLQSKLVIDKPFLTLAGQTAPGDGITISGWHTSIQNTHDVVVRFMRFRAGDINCPAFQDDALHTVDATDVIIDHVSASWSIDEVLSSTRSDRVTVQWSLITEGLWDSCHSAGPHSMGSLLRYGAGNLTFHHNLYAHNNGRNPRLGDDLSLDFVNNVVYDWGNSAGYSGDASEGTPRMNHVGNYFVAGPSTMTSRRTRAFRGGSINTLIYQSGNLIDSNVNGVRDGADTGWDMFDGFYTPQTTPFSFPSVTTDDADTAYGRVLAEGGASLARDAVDARVINEVRTDTGMIIDSQEQVGGWPLLTSGPAPLDTDGDGMPDDWEIAQGLDPLDPSDGARVTASGYTNLEIYLDSLVRPGLLDF